MNIWANVKDIVIINKIIEISSGSVGHFKSQSDRIFCNNSKSYRIQADSYGPKGIIIIIVSLKTIRFQLRIAVAIEV